MDFETLSKGKAKEFKGLSSRKERDERGLFIAEGEKCVLDIIKGFEVANIIATRDWAESNAHKLGADISKLLLTDKRGMEIISSFNSLPSVIAIMKKPEESLPNLLDASRLYIFLDEIQDPGNLGTIIRTSDWFGVYDIYASKNTVDAFNPKVVQSTMGSLSRVRVHYTDLEDIIDRNPAIKVMGTLLNGEPLDTIAAPFSGILLMGNEGRGVSENLKKKIDIAVTIPPVNASSHPDSLNVAVATGICLSHLIL